MEKKKLIIFTDIGDTIVDEGTEVRKVPFGVVYGADCIEGAKETMLELYQRGFTIVLVADGLSESFHNTMEQNGLDHIFADWIISEEVGAEKPRPIMFETAMRRLGLTEKDRERILMVGDRKYDVLGAAECGLDCVGVEFFGYAEPGELAAAGAVAVVSTAEELEQFILSH